MQGLIRDDRGHNAGNIGWLARGAALGACSGALDFLMSGGGGLSGIRAAAEVLKGERRLCGVLRRSSEGEGSDVPEAEGDEGG
jgi:hypothetical protein